jgi:hypothetical protein
MLLKSFFCQVSHPQAQPTASEIMGSLLNLSTWQQIQTHDFCLPPRHTLTPIFTY